MGLLSEGLLSMGLLATLAADALTSKVNEYKKVIKEKVKPTPKEMVAINDIFNHVIANEDLYAPKLYEHYGLKTTAKIYQKIIETIDLKIENCEDTTKKTSLKKSRGSFANDLDKFYQKIAEFEEPSDEVKKIEIAKEYIKTSELIESLSKQEETEREIYLNKCESLSEEEQNKLSDSFQESSSKKREEIFALEKQNEELLEKESQIIGVLKNEYSVYKYLEDAYEIGDEKWYFDTIFDYRKELEELKNSDNNTQNSSEIIERIHYLEEQIAELENDLQDYLEVFDENKRNIISDVVKLANEIYKSKEVIDSIRNDTCSPESTFRFSVELETEEFEFDLFDEIGSEHVMMFLINSRKKTNTLTNSDYELIENCKNKSLI